MAMARTRTFLRLLLAMIVIPAASCDNVGWGGASIAVVPPPAKVKPATPTARAAPSTTTALPSGPVLYYVHRIGASASMIPVGQVAGDSLDAISTGTDWAAFDSRYIARLLTSHAEFTLLHHGLRVGTLILQRAVSAPEDVCPRLPVALGSIELAPAADSLQEFLAMAEPDARGLSTTAQPAMTRDMQLLGPILAERLLRARKASLPGNWQFAMKQMFAFPLHDENRPAFSGSLLVHDELRTGGDSTGYSLFFVAVPTTSGYDTAFARFVDYPTQGKQASRTIDFLDWNRDGQAELVLQDFSATQSWFSAVGLHGQWGVRFDDRCETGSAIPSALPAALTDSAATPATTR
jgi:hypothetical protein